MKKKIIAGALHTMPKSRTGVLPVKSYLLLLIFLLAIAITVSCGSGSSSSDGGGGGGTEPTAATSVIGPAGGTLTGPDGVQVVVPAGALDQPTEIGIARSRAGAPEAPLAYPPAGNIYEFTPHDMPFNLPVTIRMPVPGGAPNIKVFMASPGQDWKPQPATVANGVAEWERDSFSWGMGTVCYIPTSMVNDPYWCAMPFNYHNSLSATPTQALTVITPPIQLGPGFFYQGHYRVDQAATLHFESPFWVPGNCSNPRVELYRKLRLPPSSTTGAGRWGPKQTIATQSPAVTVDGDYFTGTAIFDASFTHLYNGRNDFYLDISVDCPGVLYDAQGNVAGWDTSHYHTTGSVAAMIVDVNILPPTVFYTVGGTVSGLTGAGLVLQNNGGDNLAVAANGAFTFATSVGAGSPYNVTVFTQPTGQTCTVTNGSGTANADVTNVAVSCVPALAISPINANATDTLCFGGINSIVTFTASGGTQPYSWSASIVGLTIINATQAQWSDTSEYFCDYSGTVTITVTDSVGASASATIQVN